MLALQKTHAGPGLELRDIDPPPPPGPGDVLVAVDATGICGTDLHVDHWSAGYAAVADAAPVTLGHEFAGRIAAVGQDVHGLAVGSRVTVMPSVTCGVCASCRAGQFDRCTTRKGIGLARNGAFAGLVTAPARNCLHLPANVSSELGAMTEPLTVSAQAVAVGGTAPGDRVLILGPGMIGQGIALLARHAGAGEIVVAGKGDSHRFATLRGLGFERLIDLDVGGALPSGMDIVFEATGASGSIEQGLQALRPGGILVAVGIHGRPASFDVTLLVRGQLQIRGSYRSPIVSWQKVLDIMAASPEMFARLITHRLPLSQAHDAFALAHQRLATKVLLRPE